MTEESEVDRERQYVDGLFARLDELSADAARRLAETRRESVGGNHQSRSERDAFARLYEDTLTTLERVGDRLVFGRLEVADPEQDESAFRYIGRVGLRDAEHRPLLLDWRVPGASAFYQATAAHPMGMRARRHLTLAGREVVGVEDEVFDATLYDSERTHLQGEGALLAAVSADRTGRMTDIVATIQGEQDRIIRSAIEGVLVVQGGPGTGKTAVALHRAAYLLYSHRERLRGSGVLVVGPSPAFLTYIEQVLPSLGETGVVMASLGSLYPGVDTDRHDGARAAAVKGSAEMADLLRRAVRSRQIVPTETVTVDIEGERLVVPPSLIAAAMRKAQERGKPHNVARVTFNKAALDALTGLLAEQLRERGTTVDEADEKVLREDVRSSYDVRVLLNGAWMPLPAEKFVEDLYARPNWLASLTPHWSADRRALLRRSRGAGFTVEDVPLLDEAAELLGPFDPSGGGARRQAKAARQRDVENARIAIENMGVEGIVTAEQVAGSFAEGGDPRTIAERAAEDREWTYGHIVVDEAQELSPMQWRVLARRNPLRSFTIVGDMAQGSSPAAARSWDDVLGALARRRRGRAPRVPLDHRIEYLTVNYRTPRQIVEAAGRFAEDAGLAVTATRAVRDGDPVEHVAVSRAGLVDAVVEQVRAERRRIGTGTMGVIAPDDAIAVIRERLAATTDDLRSLEAPRPGAVTVLTGAEAKGLEFDGVVLVDPDGVGADAARAAAAVYVAMTRPTRRLVVLDVIATDEDAGAAEAGDVAA
ncbi:ATP-binding domain-containing protein [Curtobacterium sp. MCBD17_035]|uniref:HelD family protein n=1 Tax=Curtobacterium sp. MCBD17_035 TaxID=2175673 RepID=UPI000DA964E3|nr:ATP-binding domain-containing protein [Curtobacterium sp. MCBD17_035]WIB68291.1 ATP-binding domain-containing protein [Curtobacterium sp. MCBD17_035]